MWKFVLGAFLALHGMIHLGYITPIPTTDPNYPFNLGKSWLITSLSLNEPMVRLVGIILSVVTIIGFVVAGLAAVGIIIPAQWGVPVTVISSVASLLLLVLFWHPWIILGVGIDIALTVGLLWLGWQPFSSAIT